MKILILANNSSGLYDFRGELIKRLAENNSIVVSAPNDENMLGEIEKLGCTVSETFIERRGTNPFKDMALLKNYISLIKKELPQLVITYTVKPNVYGGFAARILHIPYAVNITGLGTAFQKSGILKSLVTLMYRVSLKDARIIFSENNSNKQTLVELKTAREEQCCVLNGAGVDTEKFMFTSYPENTNVRFIFIGRVMREKGIEELFYAMERLIADGTECSLDILGNCEEDYGEAIEKYEKAGWLRYYGYQKNVRPFIEKSHCLVLPSYHEGMANTILECSSMGRPVIASDISGCRESVLDGESGFLCKVCDRESLYEKMKAFCRLENKERKEMGKAARRHIETFFDKKEIVEKTVNKLFGE